MSTRRFRSLVLCLALAFTISSLPAAAVERDSHDRDLPGVQKIIKRLKNTIRALADTLTLPTP